MHNTLISEVRFSILSVSEVQQQEVVSSHIFITDYMQGLPFL